MSHLLSRLKGNTLFFLVPFWVSASGSQMRLYFFRASTQVVQLTLFAALVVVLVLVLRRTERGAPDTPFSFPNYLEHSYTRCLGAILAGAGDRSSEAGSTSPRSRRPLAGCQEREA